MACCPGLPGVVESKTRMPDLQVVDGLLWISGVEPISVRSFAWRDIYTFYRYRQQIVCTDSAQALTQGSPVGPMALLARLNPAMGNYTAVCTARSSGLPLIGHLQYAAGDRSARIIFLLPEEALAQPELNDLLEHLAVQAGSWGAFHLLAEVDENSAALEGLRRTGFSVYAWQQIWRYAPASQASNGREKNGFSSWRPAASIDEIAIRNLYQQLVPPLVQSAEPLVERRLTGWVYQKQGEVLAYVEALHGPQGVYLQPIVHPAVEDVNHVLASMLGKQASQTGRPVYLAVRSYQAWLETVICDLECQVGPRHALVVKHLVLQQRVAMPAIRGVLEKYTAEPTVPMVQNSTLHQQ